jgi:hypothetical protein
MILWITPGGFALAANSVNPDFNYLDEYQYPVPNSSDSSLDVAVVYDGEGQATVAAELELGGLSAELKELTLDVPGTSVRVLRAFYRYPSAQKIDGVTCEEDVIYQYDEQTKKDTKKVTYNCVSLLEAKAQMAADSVRETVTFPLPLAAGESARLTLVYKATGDVSQGAMGVSNFTFESPLVALDLASIRVRVDVATGLYLKGGSSDTNYQEDASLAEGLAVATIHSFSNKYSRGLDYGFSDSTAFVKSTTNLDPNESFSVSGTFATSWFALSWLQFVIAFLVLLILIILIIWGERRAAAHQQ